IRVRANPSVDIASSEDLVRSNVLICLGKNDEQFRRHFSPQLYTISCHIAPRCSRARSAGMSASIPHGSTVTDQLLDRFVNEPSARAAAGVKSRSTLQSMIDDGLFPKPIRVSRGRIAWSATEIAAWQKARIQERDDGPKGGSTGADTMPPTTKPAR